MFPKRFIRRGEKERRQSRIDVGIRVKRDALRVAVITPGLNEKLTGPTIPRNPAKMLAKPVNVIPRFMRIGIREDRKSVV